MPSTKQKTIKTTTQIADEIKTAAMKKAEVAVAEGKDKKPTTPLYKSKMMTLKELQAEENNKKIVPVDFTKLRESIVDEYLDTYDRVMSQIDDFNADPDNAPKPVPSVVEAKVTADFLSMWILANGKNRESKAAHCLTLANQFADFENHGYDPSCTHFVLTREGLVGNGGHSGKSLALTFFAPEEIDQEAWAMVPQHGKEEANTVETAASWREYYGDSLKVTLSIGADPSAVLKMDDLRLAATDVDYIQLIPYLSALSRLYKVTLEDLSQWSRGCALRYRGPTTTTRNEGTEKEPKMVDYVTYGYMKKAGRANAAIAPVRVLTFGLDCISNLLMIRKANGRPEGMSTEINAPKWAPDTKIPLKDILVAMFGMTEEQKTRLVEGIFSPTGELAPYFSALYVKPKINSTGWSAPGADRAVQICVNYAKGQTPKDACNAADDSWHRPENRLAGWDLGQKNAQGKTRAQVMVANAKIIADTIGDPSIVKVVERNEKGKDEE